MTKLYATEPREPSLRGNAETLVVQLRLLLDGLDTLESAIDPRPVERNEAANIAKAKNETIPPVSYSINTALGLIADALDRLNRIAHLVG